MSVSCKHPCTITHIGFIESSKYGMSQFHFTDEEVRDQLEALGYYNVSQERILKFREDLHRLIESDQSCESQSATLGTSGSDLDNSSFFKPKSSSPSKVTEKISSAYQPHVKPKKKINHVTKTKLPQYPVPSLSSGLRSKTQPQHTVPDNDSSFVTATDQSFAQSEETVDTSYAQAIKPRGTYNFADRINASDTEDAASVSDASSTVSERKVLQKRKVARKQKDGTSRVYDESLIQDENFGVYRCNHHHQTSYDDSADARLMRTTQAHSVPPPQRPHTARPQGRGLSENRSISGNSVVVQTSQLPAFIRPDVYPRNNLKKQDPVDKGDRYRRMWEKNKIPGADNNSHKELRWQIKAQMLYKEEPAPKPQRVYVPNSYVVPTSKKRSQLRWEARHALARGICPQTGQFDPY